MVNTRRTGSDQQQGQNNQGTGIPMPPPFYSGAVLPTPDADDGHPEQHYSGTAAGSHAAPASSTTADP